jgi:hypothetical protein
MSSYIAAALEIQLFLFSILGSCLRLWQLPSYLTFGWMNGV